MSSVDDRVVAMKFDNKQFESGAKTTMSTLDTLKSKLNFKGGSGLTDLQNQASRFNLNPVTNAVSGVSAGFVALSTVAITALSNITNKAVDAGLALAKSLTIDPITEGFSEYELQMNTIQTILANTQSEGAKLKDVNKTLKELNTYSDQTIYNFGEMAKNIGTFTAAGVDLKTSTASIKGIANVAAISGSNSQQASTAMYQLSQAIANNKVGLMDWNSVVNAGMGGKVFQEALYETGKAMGTIGKAGDDLSFDEWTKSGKSFRESLQEGWITGEVLTTTLEGFTGDLTKAQLKSKGYNDEQIAQIQKMGKMGQDAATKVKTMTQLIDTLKEGVASGWAQTWQTIFGDFNEAKASFTAVSDTLGGFIQSTSDARNKVLGDWKELGGRTVLIDGIKSAFEALISVVKPIKDAFRDIFPPATGQTLLTMTEAFRDFFDMLILSEGSSAGLRRAFRGIFGVMSVGWEILKGVFSVFTGLFGLIGQGSGSIFDLAGTVGDLLYQFSEWAKSGDSIESFFDKIGQARDAIFGPLLNILGNIIEALGQVLIVGGEAFSGIGKAAAPLMGFVENIGNALSAMFGFDDDANSAANGIANVASSVGGLSGFVSLVSNGISTLIENIRNLSLDLGPVGEAFGAMFQTIKDNFNQFFIDGLDFEDVLAIFNSGLFLMIVKSITGFMGTLEDSFGGFGDMFGGVTGVLEQTTENLKAMQQDVKAGAILKVAASIALLAAALWVLSNIDVADLGKSLGAVAILLGIMSAAMLTLAKTMTGFGAAKIVVISVAMVALGVAMLTLAAAVAIFGTMDLKTLAKGLGSVALAIGIMIGASALLNKVGGAGQLLIFSASLIILSVGLAAFAGALKLFSMLDTNDVTVGILKIMASLLAISVAMQMMPKGMALQAAALLVVSGALVVIASALMIFASMSIADIATALITLGAALGIIAIALNLMAGTLAGAAALFVAAAALAVLVPPLMLLGQMSIGSIVIALVALAGVFTVLGLAAYVLAPLVPAILGLAAAVALLGIAVLAVGVGVLAFASGMTIMAAAGTAGATALAAAILIVAATIPQVAVKIGEGMIAIANTIAKAGPVWVKLFATIIGSILDAITKLMPKIRNAFNAILDAIISVVKTNIPKIANAWLEIMNGILRAIGDNIGKIADSATRIVLEFMKAIGRNIPKLADQGAKMIIELVNGIANAIDNNAEEMGRAGGRLATAIIQGMAKGLLGGVSEVTSAAESVAKSALDGAKNFLGIHSPSREFYKLGRYVDKGFANGLIGGQGDVKAALKSLNALIRESINNAESDVKRLEEKLKKQRKAKNKDENAIKLTRKRLRRARKEEDASYAALKRMNTLNNKYRGTLVVLGQEYDRNQRKLAKANQTLADRKKLRDDEIKSTTDQYNQLPDIDEVMNLGEYHEEAKRSIQETKKFANSLRVLRDKYGLSNISYEKLLAEGVDAQPLVDDLMKGGRSAVNAFDHTNQQMKEAASALGKQAGNRLYQAGVNAAQGLVRGLKREEAAITRQMTRIANKMVKAIKKKLKIRSPSRELLDVGKYTVDGLAKGMEQNQKNVERSAERTATIALETMKNTLAKVSAAADDKIDMNPVIAPVLDLTKLTKEANKISGLVSTDPITAQVSLGQASSISNETEAAARAAAESATPTEKPSLKFEQNNYSPKALSDVEIYRQTRNQLSLAKEALNA